jgi:hypothetical protein
VLQGEGTASPFSKKQKKISDDKMKIIRYKLIFLVLFLALSPAFMLSSAKAEVQDLGDVCFYLDDGTLKPPIDSRVGVLRYGADHFVIDGMISATEPAHGTAVINGDKISITLNTSYVSADSSASLFSVIHMTVDTST